MMEICILIAQTLIICGQFYLSNKINNQSLAYNKGYFIISESNIPAARDMVIRGLDNSFNLNERISFKVSGNSDVIINAMQIEIDSRIYKNENQCYNNTYFTKDERFNKISVNLNVNESDLKKDKIDVIIKMRLRNPNGYKYTETINMRFKKESETRWDLIKYNMTMN